MLRALKIFVVISILVIGAAAQASNLPEPIHPPVVAKKTDAKLELGLQTPNELEGYKFFADGKLSKLKLGISTRDDVKAVMGDTKSRSDYADYYELDSDWQVQFIYFKEAPASYVSELSGGVQKNYKLIPAPEFIGKLKSVTLYSQKPLSFSQMIFPEAFSRQRRIPEVDQEKVVLFDSYRDRYGLRYRIFNSITYRVPEEKRTLSDSRRNRSQGDLMEITYEIPREFEANIYVRESWDKPLFEITANPLFPK